MYLAIPIHPFMFTLAVMYLDLDGGGGGGAGGRGSGIHFSLKISPLIISLKFWVIH